MQIFFIVSYAQYFQNTVISAKKLPDPTHVVRGFVWVCISIDCQQKQLKWATHI